MALAMYDVATRFLDELPYYESLRTLSIQSLLLAAASMSPIYGLSPY